MAYRHLFLFVVTGLIAAGCGTGQTRSVAEGPSGSETPPRDPNGPPGSADDSAAPSDDVPPSADDAPPRSSDAPSGGGNLGALCEQLCARIRGQQCDGQSIFEMDEVCSSGCEIPAQAIPCEPELEGLFGCLLNLNSFCDGQQTEAEAEVCRSALDDFGECADTIDMQNPNPDPDPGQDCSTRGGCDCPTECNTCLCEAVSQEDLMACTELCAMP